MKALLKGKATRRKFLIIVGLILLVIILLRLFAIPKLLNVESFYVIYLISILDNLFISLLIGVFLGLFLFYIEIPDREKEVSIIEPIRLKEIFAKARTETDFWHFSGGAGRYTRAVTIPEISRISQENNAHRRITILLLNPKNESLCKSYASYRKSLNSSKNSKNEWTHEYVRNEIIATIASAIIYKSNNSLLDIKVYLKNNFSTLRIDQSKMYSIVTKEDKKEPAILVPPDTFLYRTYNEEILQTAKQCELLDLSFNLNDCIIGKVSKEDVLGICTHLNFDGFLNEKDYKIIAKTLNKNQNPYG